MLDNVTERSYKNYNREGARVVGVGKGGGGVRRDHFANDMIVFMGLKGEHFIFCRM